jgi:predicted phage-related endonuclease
MRVDELPFGKSIGGHAMASILGYNPYQSRLELYEVLTGKKESSFVPSFESDAGHALEPVIIKHWALENGAEVEAGVNLVHNEKIYLTGHLDAIATLSDGSQVVLEAKTANFAKAMEFGQTGTDQVPKNYAIQVMHYMMLAGLSEGRIAARFKDTLHEYVLHADKALEDAMMEAATNFWVNHVLADIPPAPVTPKDFTSYYKKSNGKTIDATPEIFEAWERLAQIKENIKELDAQKEMLSGIIKGHMGFNDSLIFGGKVLATWKSGPSNRFDSTALKEIMPDIYEKFYRNGETRVLLIKK